MKQKIAFISDLHLDPSCKLINKRWNDFVKWASFNIQELYILGDFFAVWAVPEAERPMKLDPNQATLIKFPIN